MHAIIPDTDDTIPLRMLVISDLQRVTGSRRTSIWYGRVVVLLVFLVQAVTSSFLFVRRLHVQGGHYWIDNKNGVIALSGTVAGVLSLSIQLLNITWEVKPFHTQQSHAIFRHECQFSNVINFEILPAIWIHTKIGYGVLRSWGMLHWLHGEEPLLVVFGVIFGIVCIHLNMISILLSKNMERFRLTCFTIPYLTYFVCTVSISFSEQPDFGRWKDPLADKLWVF
jgi:hypothetical protein